MAPVACLSKGVARISPSRMRPTYARLDLLPFFLLHGFFYSIAHAPRVQTVLQQFAVPLIMGLSFVIHLLAFLFEVWSVRWFHAVRCVPSTLEDADCVMVEPEAHAGQAAVVPLKRVNSPQAVNPLKQGAVVAEAAIIASTPLADIAKSWVRTSAIQFTFQSCNYHLVASARSPGGVAFDRLDCPDAAPVHVYTRWHGWSDARSVEAAVAKYGANAIVMPAPAFGELMAEHALAPFFVFQIGCVALWALDDYWYYSLFTLFMLVSLEAVLVLARMKQQQQLRGMRPPPLPLHVFRSGSWRIVTSDQLVPGDLVSVSQTVPTGASALMASLPGAQQRGAASAGGAPVTVVCPADMLILRGTAVVNEAMLTGESAPQMKDAITCDETAPSGGAAGAAAGSGASTLPGGAHSGSRLNAFLAEGSRSHMRHVVFGGTTVMQSATHSDSDEEAEEGGSGGGDLLAHIPPPPDGGATAVVLRTGAYTSQGELMRTIQHSTSKVSAGNREAFVFICGLLVFALYSSHYVLTHAWNDPARNRWKLILHCIMIITSVVPPELPVELALAVNSSIAALARRGIFCTEPWRVTLAGKVDVAAFDKTGTLTSDEFTVNGVVLLGEGGGSGSGGRDARLVPAPSVPLATLHVLAGCHSLMSIPAPPPPPPAPAARGQPAPPPPPPSSSFRPRRIMIGDPLEKSTLTAAGWTVSEDGVARPSTQGTSGDSDDRSGSAVAAAVRALGRPQPTGQSVKPVKRWPFSAEVKRMSCAVAAVTPASPVSTSLDPLDTIARSATSAQLRIVAKGAPEVMAALLTTVPAGYHETYRALTLTGARVLTLAYRVLPASVTPAEVRGWPRSRAERDLTFAGFLALSSPLKTDSVRTVGELTGSGHRVMMITGDAPFTAVAVAQQCGIIGDGGIGAAVADKEALPGSSSAGSDVWILEQPAPTASAGNSGGSAGSPVGAGGGDFGLTWSIVSLPPRSSDTSSTAAVGAVVDSLGGSGEGGTRVRSLRFDAQALLDVILPAKERALPKAGATAPPPGAAICVTGAALRVLTLVKAAAARPASPGAAPSPAEAALRPLVNPLIYGLSLCAAVFARVSPDQKEVVIVTLNSGGQTAGMEGEEEEQRKKQGGKPSQSIGVRHTTLMCGDGTNDVGALKQAGVGVSIISNPELERQYDVLRLKQATGGKERREKAIAESKARLLSVAKGDPNHWAAKAAAKLERDMRSREETVDEGEEEELTALLKAERASATLAAPAPGTDDGGAAGVLEGMLLRGLQPQPGASPAVGAPVDPAAAKRAEMNKQLADKLKEMQAEQDGMGGAGGPVMVALGDASIASPFTSKLPSPAAVVEILRQGRCTLVTTHQMYKILAVNSLVLSYQLSVLYLYGVKAGDYQATIGGMSVAAFFFFISWAKPLKRLAPVRPHTSVFNAPLILAVAGQFLIHLTVLATAVGLCRPFAAVDAVLTSAASGMADPEATLSSEEASAAIRALLSGGNWSLPAELAGNGTANGTEIAAAQGGAVEGADEEGEASTAAAAAARDQAAALMAGVAPLDGASAPLYSAGGDSEFDEFAVGALGGVEFAGKRTAATAAPAPTPVDLKAALLAKKAAGASSSSTSGEEAGAGGEGKKEKRAFLEDAKFAPNIINTVVFLVSTSSQAATFLVNYTGKPFMQPLRENRGEFGVLRTLRVFGGRLTGLFLSH